MTFGPLTPEIGSGVWGIPANFNGFRILAALLHGTLVVGVSQTAAFNRGRHLYSAGWPSGWALAHILVIINVLVAVSKGMWAVKLCSIKILWFLIEKLQTPLVSLMLTLMLSGAYAESPKGLKVGDRVKVDVSAERLEELQKERDAWDPELAKVGSTISK